MDEQTTINADPVRSTSTWNSAPFVYVVVPTCPYCGSVEYDRKRTESAGDGSFTKKVVCRSCGAKYKIVLELPETGSCENEFRTIVPGEFDL